MILRVRTFLAEGVRRVQELVAGLNLSSVAHLRDMTNAFSSTCDEDRFDTLDELVPDDGLGFG